MRRTRRLRTLIAGALLAAFALGLFSSCRKSDVVALYFAVDPGTGNTFDPQIAGTGAVETAVLNCYEGLVYLDETGRVVPGVAESWDVTDGGLTYVFHLRADAKWHLSSTAAEALGEKLSGFSDKVTAEDFAFALRRAVDPLTGARDASLLENISGAREILDGTRDTSVLGVSAPDERTLRIRLTQPQSDFLEILTLPLCMPCNRVFFEATGGRYGLYIKYMLSNGPFFLTRFDFEEGSYRLAKNPDYAGAHPAAADVVWLYHRPDDQTVLERLGSGEYTGVVAPPGFSEGRDVGGYQSVKVPDVLWAFILNAGGKVCENADYRAAFCRAIPMTELLKALDKTQTASVLPGVLSGYPSAAPAEPDVKSAKAFLRRGLKERGEDTAALSILCDAAFETAVRRLLQEYQKMLGIEMAVSVTAVPREELAAKVEAGEYDAALYPLRTPLSGASRYFEEVGRLVRFSDPDYDAAVRALRYSAAEDAGAVQTLTGRLLGLSLLHPLWQGETTVLLSGSVTGLIVLPGRDRIYFYSAVPD